MKVVQSIHVILFFVLISSGCQKPNESSTKLHVGGKLINAIDSVGIANRKITITDEFSIKGFYGGSTLADGASVATTTDINGNYSADIVISQNHSGFQITIDNHDSLFTDELFNDDLVALFINSVNYTYDNSKLNVVVYPRAFINVTFKSLTPIKNGDFFIVDISTELNPNNHNGFNTGDWNYGSTEKKSRTFTIAKVKTFLDITWNQNYYNQPYHHYNETLVLNPQEVKEIILQ